MSLSWGSLQETLAERGVTVDARCVEDLRTFWQLLEEAGRTTNLTRIQGEAAFLEKHAFDGLLGLPHLDRSPEGPWVDVGSGCGVPGLILALARRERRVTLVESTGKKTVFLERAREALGLETVEVRTERAEDTGRGPLRGTFAAAVTRAVGPEATCLELTLPLLAPAGVCVLYRGPTADPGDLAAVCEQLGGDPPAEHRTSLPSGEGRRFVVVVQRQLSPETYPRRVGVPAKRPLSP